MIATFSRDEIGFWPKFGYGKRVLPGFTVYRDRIWDKFINLANPIAFLYSL
jgi:hypothetical protein